MTVIVAFSGKLGSGKTFAAKLLIERLQLVNRAHIVSFGDAIKRLAATATGVELKQMYTTEGKNLPIALYNDATLGQLFQRIGRVWRHEFGDDIFVRTLLEQEKSLPQAERNDIRFIDDVRTKAEFDAIREAGGTLVRLEGDPCDVRKQSTRDLNDSTETALDAVPRDQWDAVIQNDVPDPHKLYEALLNQVWLPFVTPHLLQATS